MTDENEQNQNIESDNKYSRGKIYSIRSPHTDKIYIGCTINELPKRYFDHIKQKTTEAEKIIQFGDSYIELLENFSCNDRNELLKREGELIRANGDKCVNKKSKCTPEQTKENNKKYWAKKKYWENRRK